MTRYIFNARDIAAYFKYFNVPQYLEVSYMQCVFNIGTPLLAAPLCKDFEKFKGEVYRELYYLWASGFEDEKSDIACVTAGGDRSLICDQECIVLETYMKLITLHLVFTKNLPYVNLNFAGLPLSLGIECEYDVFEQNVVKCIESLDLVTKDKFGKYFDLNLGVSDELLQVSLSEDFKARIHAGADIRESLRKEQKDKMSELKEKSLKLFENIGLSKKTERRKLPNIPTNQKPVLRKSLGEKANRSTTSRNQPKGIPLEDKRHKDGN